MCRCEASRIHSILLMWRGTWGPYYALKFILSLECFRPISIVSVVLLLSVFRFFVIWGPLWHSWKLLWEVITGNKILFWVFTWQPMVPIFGIKWLLCTLLYHCEYKEKFSMEKKGVATRYFCCFEAGTSMGESTSAKIESSNSLCKLIMSTNSFREMIPKSIDSIKELIILDVNYIIWI